MKPVPGFLNLAFARGRFFLFQSTGGLTMKRLLLFILFLAPVSLSAQVQPDALMLRYPDVSANRIVFVFAGDLWTVSKDGGMAYKLSSPKGEELFPKFSPDGRHIAFSGNYDGNTDVYIMPTEGGTPERLTHHSASDYVVEWYPDGKHILYRSGMNSPRRRFNQFYRQKISGGLPEQLPLAYGEIATFNADGSKMIFQTISREMRTWKRYRGGMASDLWLYDFKKNHSEKITQFDGTDALPMWHGNTVYFLSDRDTNKKLNIWAYNMDTKSFRPITRFDTYDVKWPSIGATDIIFENGGKLYLVNLEADVLKEVNVQVPSDFPKVRTQIKNLSKNISSFDLSPAGKRAVFEARGEVLTIPQKHGSVRNLTNTSGVAERYPSWSPDGKYIAYFADKTGEYELYIRPGDGSGAERQITKGGKAFRYRPLWSPDSKKIAFSDKSGTLFYLNISDGKPRQVDKDDLFANVNYSWSSDSRWIAYDRYDGFTTRVIRVYDTASNKAFNITSDYYNNSNPVFDPEGKYLYFYSDRSFNPIYSDYDNTWVYPNATNLYAAALRDDVPSPLAPRSDEAEIKDDDTDGEKEGDEDSGSEKDPEDISIDFEGIEQRIVKITDIGNVGNLSAVKGKIIYQKAPLAGTAKPGQPAGILHYFDLEDRESKTIISGIDTYTLSADGKKVLYKAGNTYGIIDLAEGKNVGDDKIATEELSATINPIEEWEQMFHDAWRIERDYFYDPGMHGLDWEAIRKRYAALLPFVADRADLNYVLGEMIAELNASHTYVRGGDIEQPERISVGLLGCDFEADETNKRYRISKIYAGGPWDYAEIRSPLREPGIDVNEGDYLLAVNGQPLDFKKDPWAAFQGLADEVVTLTINSKPSAEGATDVLVKPVVSESRLRYLSWIEENRKRVEKASGGKAGYIYVPNTGIDGQTELVRQFISQHKKEALVIDERFNSGGQIPDRFIELLNRDVYNFWARRDFKDYRTPFVMHRGPKVMLINGWSGSGGDAFPYYFKKARLGKLVGKRTWGGLIGISGNPGLVDGGSVTVPTFGMWDTEGNWAVEGYGVDPDYDVENAPHELVAGRDPQLEKAVEVVLEELKKNPLPKLTKPAYPDRSQ